MKYSTAQEFLEATEVTAELRQLNPEYTEFICLVLEYQGNEVLLLMSDEGFSVPADALLVLSETFAIVEVYSFARFCKELDLDPANPASRRYYDSTQGFACDVEALLGETLYTELLLIGKDGE